MLITVCVGKIHRATVTEADLNYVGSITIDEVLMKAAGILPFQQVTITNITNGAIWYTYAMAGPANKGDICLNGSPAHHFHPGNLVIILAYAQVEPSELPNIQPKLVFVDGKNKITKVQDHGEMKAETKNT